MTHKINKLPAFALEEAKKYNDAPTPKGQYPKNLNLYDLLHIEDGVVLSAIKSKDDYVRLIDSVDSEGATLILQLNPTLKIPSSILDVSIEGTAEKIKLSGDLNDLCFNDVYRKYKTDFNLESLNNFFFLASETDLTQFIELDEESGLRLIPDDIEVMAFFNTNVDYNHPSQTFRESNLDTWQIKRYIPSKKLNIKITTDRVVPKNVKEIRVYYQNNFMLYGDTLEGEGVGAVEDYEHKFFHFENDNITLKETFDYNTPTKVLSVVSSSSVELELSDAGEYAYAVDCIAKAENGGSGGTADTGLVKCKAEGGTIRPNTENEYGLSQGAKVKRQFATSGRAYNFLEVMRKDVDYIYFGTYSFKLWLFGSQAPEMIEKIIKPSFGANKHPILKSVIAGTTTGDVFPDLPSEVDSQIITANNVVAKNKRFESAKWLYNVDYESFDDLKNWPISQLEFPWRISIASKPWRQRRYDSPSLIDEIKTILDRKPSFNGSTDYYQIQDGEASHTNMALPLASATGYETFSGEYMLGISSIPNGLEQITREVETQNRSSLVTYATGKDGVIFNSVCKFKFPTPSNYYYNRLKQSWQYKQLGKVRINYEDRRIERVSGQPIILQKKFYPDNSESVIESIQAHKQWVDTGGTYIVEFLDKDGNWPLVEDPVSGEQKPIFPIAYGSNLLNGKPKDYRYETIFAGT